MMRVTTDAPFVPVAIADHPSGVWHDERVFPCMVEIDGDTLRDAFARPIGYRVYRRQKPSPGEAAEVAHGKPAVATNEWAVAPTVDYPVAHNQIILLDDQVTLLPIQQYGAHACGAGVDQQDVIDEQAVADCHAVVVRPNSIEFYSATRPWRVMGSTPTVKAAPKRA